VPGHDVVQIVDMTESGYILVQALDRSSGISPPVLLRLFNHVWTVIQEAGGNKFFKKAPMQATKSFSASLKLAVSLLLLGFTGLTPATLSAEPVTLPEWAKPIESSLPKISPDVISEVDEIYWYNVCNEEYRALPNRKAQYQSNEMRMVELKEQAGQAMIWQYLKSTDHGGSPRVLSGLAKDREVAAWLMPILRFRIEWLKKAISDDEMKGYFEKHRIAWEIGEIEEYLFSQGEFSDIENLNIVHNEVFKRGAAYSDRASPERIAEQIKAMEKARKVGDQPYWQWSAQYLISEGVLTPDVLKPESKELAVANDRDRPKPLGPRKPLPETTIPTPTQQPRITWPIWILIGLVSVGLLYWACRKSRSPAGN
jgi:hypothetical protein